MKFLLVAINAKYIHSNPAIYSLRAFVGTGRQEYVELAEYTINQQVAEILADIYRRKPTVIGFSCYIWNWRMVQELLVEVPKILPEVNIWLGGSEVSFGCENILKQYPKVSGIMVGEGEVTFRDLLEYYVEDYKFKHVYTLEEMERKIRNGNTGPEGSPLRKPENIWEIRGLYLRSGYTPARALTDMNRIPFLYHDLKPFENKIIYYESSRGCPYRCSYCLSSIDKWVRLRDTNVVKEELKFFLENRVKQVKFVDRTFNVDHEHSMEIWRYILENDNGVTNFHFEISADILREDEIALLNQMRPGLVQLEIGVQTTNPKTLEAIKRVMNVERLEQIVAAIHRGNNVHQHLDLIAGLPFEDYESFKESFNRVYRMKPQQLQLGFLKVLKGSEMYERAEEYGICYQSNPPYEVLSTGWLSYEEVLRLKGVEEMVELYYNSGQFAHTLAVLEQEFENPFDLYEALADFYREKGYFVNNPARVYRYNILLEFVQEFILKSDVREAGIENVDAIYRELLTYDMYLRENMKSRPEFAADLAPLKEAIRDFYREEEVQRKYLPDYAEYDWKQLSKMTHVEVFCYPVWDKEKMWEMRKGIGKNLPDVAGKAPESYFILFDYQKRNPLNYEAETRHFK